MDLTEPLDHTRSLPDASSKEVTELHKTQTSAEDFLPDVQETEGNDAATSAGIVAQDTPDAAANPTATSSDFEPQLPESTTSAAQECGDDDDNDGGDVAATTHIRGLAQSRRRRAKTKEERLASKGEKAGNPGRFKGAALEYLESLFPDYMAIDKTSPGKIKRLGDFWFRVMSQFWVKFDWREFEEPQNQGDREETLENVQDSVKGWFRYREKTASGGEKNPWTEFLKSARDASHRAPRRMPAWQLYSTRHPELIRERAGERTTIGERNKAAKAMFEDLPEEEQTKWIEEAQAIYDGGAKKYLDALKSGASKDPDEQQNDDPSFFLSAISPI